MGTMVDDVGRVAIGLAPSAFPPASTSWNSTGVHAYGSCWLAFMSIVPPPRDVGWPSMSPGTSPAASAPRGSSAATGAVRRRSARAPRAGQAPIHVRHGRTRPQDGLHRRKKSGAGSRCVVWGREWRGASRLTRSPPPARRSTTANGCIQYWAICRPASMSAPWQRKNLSLCPKLLDQYSFKATHRFY